MTTNGFDLNSLTAEVEALGERENWPPALVFKANLVLEELTLNINNYGGNDGIRQIEITLNSETDRLIIEVIDDGSPFDPTTDATLPDTNAPIEDRPVGGLGLHLVRTMMDEMQYKREQGKNHVILVAHSDR
jgi:anti-sigma regulatory factor (Ser/Thr protein kinase)